MFAGLASATCRLHAPGQLPDLLNFGYSLQEGDNINPDPVRLSRGLDDILQLERGVWHLVNTQHMLVIPATVTSFLGSRCFIHAGLQFLRSVSLSLHSGSHHRPLSLCGLSWPRRNHLENSKQSGAGADPAAWVPGRGSWGLARRAEAEASQALAFSCVT